MVQNFVFFFGGLDWWVWSRQSAGMKFKATKISLKGWEASS